MEAEYQALKEKRKTQNIHELQKHIDLLDKHKIKYKAFNNGLHFQIEAPNKLGITVNFWPSTGRWGCHKSENMKAWIKKKGYSGWGFKSLLHFLNWLKTQ